MSIKQSYSIIIFFVIVIGIIQFNPNVEGATQFFANNRFTENGIEWCEEEKPRYELLGEAVWLEHHRYSIEARVCAHLIHDPLWEYIGDDRTQKLIERSEYYVEIEITESEKEAETGIDDPTPAVIIPSWIRNNALWWSQGLIDDADFISGIKYLIDQEIMHVPASQGSTEPQLSVVPNWIKDTAGWWANGKVSDDDFVNGIQYMISNGYMRISTQTIECSGEKLCLNGKVTQIVDGDTLYVEGYEIRLSLTNTPETYQDGFREATVFTESLCPVGSTATVDQDDLQPFDKYQRMVAKVYCGGKNLNAELLYNGNANILTQYCSTSEFSNEDWAIKYGC